MKITRISILIAALGLLGWSLGAVEPATANSGHQSYDLNGFTGIEASSGVQVTLKQDKNFSVIANGSPEALDSLNIRVRGRVLHIGFRPHFGIGWGKPVQVEVSMPDLNRVRLSGAASLTMRFDTRHSPRFVFDLSGAASLQGVLIGSVVSADVSGGSTVRIEGYAESAVIGVNGGSRMESPDFAVDTATILLSGGAFAALAVQSNIIVKASGGSHLDYRGNPEIRKALSGGASVSRIK